MFSKPIIVASLANSVVQSTLIKMTGTFPTQVDGQSTYSAEIGCGLCLGYSDGKWISKDATYATIDSAASVSVGSTSPDTDKVTGYICCKDAATKETSSANTFCTAGVKQSSGVDINVVTTANTAHYFQAVLAQCPHQKDNCTAAALKADGTTTITLSDDRYIELTEVKSSVTLKLLIVSAPGSSPSMKQRKGDVCTWVVAGKCDAPVLTVPSTSGALSASPSHEWEIQVTEWSDEYTNAAADSTWTTLSGASNKLYYPPVSDLSTIITDLDTQNVEKTAPNGIYGEVLFKNPIKTGTTYTSVPGLTLVAWMETIKAQYDIYNADVALYNADNDLWKKYAEYTTPPAGLFDAIFGAAEDPDKPTTRSVPLQPTQPADVPDTIKSLGLGATTSPDSPALYTSKGGWGYPQAYMVTPISECTVKPWGTLAGGGQNSATTTKFSDSDTLLSIRKTSNKKDGSYVTNCDKSYIMITGWLKVVPAAAKTIELKVTASEFASNLEERIPTRPGAVTAPVAAPAGASYLSLAYAAASIALTALYLV